MGFFFFFGTDRDMKVSVHLPESFKLSSMAYLSHGFLLGSGAGARALAKAGAGSSQVCQYTHTWTCEKRLTEPLMWTLLLLSTTGAMFSSSARSSLFTWKKDALLCPLSCVFEGRDLCEDMR